MPKTFGLDRPPDTDATAWNNRVVAYGGPFEVCHKLGVSLEARGYDDIGVRHVTRGTTSLLVASLSGSAAGVFVLTLKTIPMTTRKRHTPQQVVRKLTQADRMLAEGKEIAPGNF